MSIMADDKTTPTDSGEEAVIEEHVRQLMEPGQPDPVETTAPVTAEEPADKPLPPMDIFAGKTPSVSRVPLKPVESKPAATDPTDSTDDPETDKAVDEITKAEGDEVLAADDQAAKAHVMKSSLWERFRNTLADWWGDPRKRYTSLGVIVAIIVAVAAVPVSRYFVLNAAGLRSQVSLKVFDKTTDLPLKNVNVTLAGQTIRTDASGQAHLSHVRLGKQVLTVQKQAFAPYTTTVTVGLGGLTLPDVSLKAVGSQFTFTLTDYLSGKPVQGAEVSSGQATAQSDKTGKAILTVQPKDGQKLQINVTAKGYRVEKLELDPTITTPTAVHLVTAAKEIFISKASGNYDLYSMDIDGKNRQVILAGTGNENQNMQLSVSPDGSRVALVSTRDNQRDSSGYLLSTLTLLNTDGSSALTIDHSEQLVLLGWSDSKLIYQETVAGASAANPNRQRLISYDAAAGKRLQLASANNFNAALLAGGTVYYGTSSTDPSITPGFFRISPNATSRQTLFNQEIWTAFRTDYDTLTMQGPTGWFSYHLGDSAVKPATAPDNYTFRQYVDSPDGRHSLWVDSRDGKGVLLSHDIAGNDDSTVATQPGLTQALRWLDNNTVIYRVNTMQETADYAVSLLGGQPKKLADVTGTY